MHLIYRARKTFTFAVAISIQLLAINWRPCATAETATTKSPWQRIVIVGASVSAGFTESELFGGPKTAQYRLNHYVDAALSVPHEPVQNLASTMFFMQPEQLGRQQVEKAIKAKPTLVLGVDFLFWFCYGEADSESERVQIFETGLKLLEAFQCPLLLGDIPDASHAVTTGMLTAEQLPSIKTMSAANRRLKEWAATRKQVVVLGVSDFMRNAMANQALTVHGQTWRSGKTRAFLQSDSLHTSARGCAALTLVIFDALPPTRTARGASNVRWDIDEVFRRGFNFSQTSLSSVKQTAPPVPTKK